MKTATYFHAGCPVCLDAERNFIETLDGTSLDVERVHLSEAPARIDEARAAGVASVPALVVDGQAFHINFGASLDDLVA